MTYSVDIIDFDSAAVVKSILCISEREANKVDNGLNINLNHDKYYTLIRAKRETEKPNDGTGDN